MNKIAVTIYTDGACKGNPGVGGWGALLIAANGQEKELSGASAATTNNRMELMAVIEALKALNRPCEVALYVDSQYVLKGMTEWVAGWKAKQWRTASGQAVKNTDLWLILDAIVEESGHRIKWHWVKGHAGNEGNERADALANAAVSTLLSSKESN